MKKFVTIITIILMSVSAYAAKEPIVGNENVSAVIDEFYPGLKDYYESGVLNIASLTEETLADGTVEYNIKYNFTRSMYEGEDLTKVLKKKYPDIYALRRAGLIKDVVVYKFVDKNTGLIFENVLYNWIEPMRRAWTPRRHR